MKLLDIIDSTFRRNARYRNFGTISGGFAMEARQPFAEVIWSNTVGLLTELANDVIINNIGIDKGKRMLFADYKAFFESYGQIVLNLYFANGIVVIGYAEGLGFRLLADSEFIKSEDHRGVVTVKAVDERLSTYVMVSDAHREHGTSDKGLVRGYLTYIDNLMNSSNTINARLGLTVFASPKNEEKLNTTVLTKEQAEEMEQNISEGYGSLSRQKQFALFRQPMDFITINLAAADLKLQEKIKMAVCIIADRIKVPANQIAMIDAAGSKSFANGSEALVGDFAKYQSFERLFNKTFGRMAFELGLSIDYTIYNKPNISTSENHLI